MNRIEQWIASSVGKVGIEFDNCLFWQFIFKETVYFPGYIAFYFSLNHILQRPSGIVLRKLNLKFTLKIILSSNINKKDISK